MQVFRALDQLPSISGSEVMAKKFQIFQECCRGLAEISLINLRHFGHNFGTRNARKSIKPSKDSYYSLVSNKNSSQKMALGNQGPMTSS